MGKKANPAVIGGFVVGAIALAALGLLVFGSGEFLKEKMPWVSYFPGSVDGLQVGAPVTFKGVKIGQVTDIRVTVDAGENVVRIPVHWELQPDRVVLIGVSEAEMAEMRTTGERPLTQVLIKRGLRAQLQLQSFVTGQKMIQLDFFPDTPINLVGGDGEGKLPEFPTTESSTEKLTKTIENLPLGELMDDARRVLKSLDQLVEKLDNQTLPAIHASMNQAKETLASYGEGSRVNYELGNTLKETAGAARSLRVLADYLERHPEALLQGKGRPGGNQK